MKKITLNLLMILLCVNAFGQIAYYDAIKLSDTSNNIGVKNGKVCIKNNDIQLEILANYAENDTNIIILERFQNNPFVVLEAPITTFQDDDAVVKKPIPFPFLAGMDANTVAQGLSQFMIERAKAELSVAFFERFRKFTEENDEIRYLFPVTSERMAGLLAYHYTEMLTQLRNAFYEDLNNLPDNILVFLQEGDDFEDLRKTNPDFIIAINTLKLMRQIEYLSPAEFINQLPQITLEASEAAKTDADKQKVQNFETTLNLVAIYSNSLRDTSEKRNWITSNDFFENIAKDSIARRIYTGLIYQQIKQKELKFNGEFVVNTIKENEAAYKWYEHRVDGFIFLANKVDFTMQNIKDKKFDNSHMYSYINTLLDMGNFGNQFVEKYYGYDTYKKFNNYLSLTKDANDIYRYVYQKEYASAIMASANLFEKIYPYQVIDINALQNNYTINKSQLSTINAPTFNSAGINSVKIVSHNNQCVLGISKWKKAGKAVNKDIRAYLTEVSNEKSGTEYKAPRETKTFVIDTNEIYAKLQSEFAKNEKSQNWIEKYKKYGTFMANLVQAETPEQVSQAIEAAALPVGSSSIKKHSDFNVSVNGYLGGFGKFGSVDKTQNAWSSRMSVSAPIGIAVSHGFNKGGSVSLTGTIIDVGAIVDYQLANDSSYIESTITWGNLFSPGLFFVYGMACDLPLSVGIGGQYGPGLSSINGVDNITINEPDWRFGIAIAVDIPLFTIYNRPKIKK